MKSKPCALPLAWILVVLIAALGAALAAIPAARGRDLPERDSRNPPASALHPAGVKLPDSLQATR